MKARGSLKLLIFV